MSEPLSGTHADEVREIAQQEVGRFARILADEIARTPLRADGNLNARDFWKAVNDAIKAWDDGKIA